MTTLARSVTSSPRGRDAAASAAAGGSVSEILPPAETPATSAGAPPQAIDIPAATHSAAAMRRPRVTPLPE